MLDALFYLPGPLPRAPTLESSFHDHGSYEIPVGVRNCMYTQGIANLLQTQAPIRMMSMALDKSRVNAMGLFVSPIVLPSNHGFWAHPQERKPAVIDFQIP